MELFANIGMLKALYEFVLWASFLSVCATCIYFNAFAGSLVSLAGLYWIGCVLRRK